MTLLDVVRWVLPVGSMAIAVYSFQSWLFARAVERKATDRLIESLKKECRAQEDLAQKQQQYIVALEEHVVWLRGLLGFPEQIPTPKESNRLN